MDVSEDCAITQITCDPKTKRLAVGLSNGSIALLNAPTPKVLEPAAKAIPSANDIPINSMGTLMRGHNLLCAGYATGAVKIFDFDGQQCLEINSHSRNLNALAVHPSRSVIATAGDDTFLNVFEIAGDSLTSLKVNLQSSSRINDMLLVGVGFAGDNQENVIAVPYDFSTMVVLTVI